MKRIMVAGLWLLICGQLGITAGLQPDAFAYESGTVINGATVQGKITFTGTGPEPKTFELRRYYDREYCATLSDGKGHRLLKEVNVGQDGGLKDVVVERDHIAHVLLQNVLIVSHLRFLSF